MAYRIFWTPIAVQDLRDICDFISRDNLDAAQRMGEELIKQSEAIRMQRGGCKLFSSAAVEQKT